VAKLFGLGRTGKEAPYLLRLFGTRDIVVGMGTLLAAPDERRGWLRFGVLCDAGDGIAAAAGRRSGHLSSGTGSLVAVPAAAVGLGAIALRSDAARR
jgi:hypothetical protein